MQTRYSSLVHDRLVRYHLDVFRPWRELGMDPIDAMLGREGIMASISGRSVPLESIGESMMLGRKAVRARFDKIAALGLPYGDVGAARGDKEAQRILLEYNRQFSDTAVDSLFKCAHEMDAIHRAGDAIKLGLLGENVRY